ncbi:MAG: PSD1 and planctomycete cytochrome C domain-containing protein [Planctomycetaceae bacterium]
MNIVCRIVSWGLPLFAVLVGVSSSHSAEPISFNRDIRPILSQNCLACHGFDAKQRKADLRLDIAEGAYAERDGAFAIKPGNLEQSELWRRITSTDPDVMMPPPDSKKSLTDAEKETLRRWIEEGAPYQKHWAFEPPVAAELPAVGNAAWSTNPVDRFLLARLEHERLTPRPEADRSTLIRRVSFALTGLPPTSAEVEEYLADQSPTVYENMVDRYLASPRYGEEMARHWLDVARYADTHGLHLDNERTMWAYRDWVIKAFNENKNFDEFTIEQLAGDLLPNPTNDQLIATGFNRCNVTTSEGGSIEQEFLYRYAVDRTSTMIQIWMGLTGGCAVCHDHKYDPLTTREFYSLYSFFYSAADPAMDKNINITDPFFKMTSDEHKTELAQLQALEDEAKRLLEEAATKVEYHDPATTVAANGEGAAPAKVAITDLWLDDFFPQGSTTACSSRNPSIWSTSAEIDAAMGQRSLRQASANNYHDKFTSPVVPYVIPENPRLSVWVRIDAKAKPQSLRIEITTDKTNRKLIWSPPSTDGSHLTNNDWVGDLPSPGEWTQLEVPAEKLGLTPGENVTGIMLAQFGGVAWWDGLSIAGEVNPATDLRSSFTVWWQSRKDKDSPGIPAELAETLKKGPEANPTDELRAQLLRYYLAYISRPADDAELHQRQQAWIDARSAKSTLEESIPGTFIYKDLETPRDAFIMVRGQYDKPSDKVEPAVPAFLPALVNIDPAKRANRLDLANWLLSAEHPMTARVTVNRFWQQFFGTGLVKTSDDFGSRGDVPSHPELLDWLAVHYRESGWDTKAFVRMLVTSSAFRQDARVTSELRERDPENRLHARGPRFRLDAEQIRDNALFVSGLINLQMGGHGVNSYQPPNIWEPVGYSDSNTRYYLQDHGAGLYRRSIYTFLKRTAPPPFMSNFDAPNREQFCARRERSNTPLQALQLLNDTQHFEAARAFAERILTEGGATPNERIAFAYRAVLSRDPKVEELRIVEQTLQTYLTRYAADLNAAKEVIAVGESTPNEKLEPTELAAYTLIANLILNLDETVTRN